MEDNRGREIKLSTTFQLTSERVYLNIKSLGTNVTTLILMLCVPALFCFSAVIIAPVYYDFGVIISASVMLVSFITYGTIAGTFRRSTLNKNSNTTAAVKWVDNLATIVTMLFLGYFITMFVIVLIWVFDIMGILLVDFNEHSKNHPITFMQSIGFINIFYNATLIIVITYSMSYLFQGFFDSDMMFFTLALLMLILLLLLGATLNDYFGLYEDGVHYTGEWSTPFRDEGFIPSLLFPFYAPSQMLRLNADALQSVDYNIFDTWTWMQGEDSWRYNILWFTPYFHIIGWWFLGFAYKATGLSKTQ